jgi:predicted kinase
LEPIVIARNSLVVLCGPAGSGKSTFATKHFLPTQVVSSDECRALVSDDPANQRISSIAFDLMHFIIEKRLYLKRLTVADATNLERPMRKWMVNTARQLRVKPIAIVFDVPLETCLARNANRGRIVPEEAVRKQRRMLDRTLAAIEYEGFTAVFVLNEAAQCEITIEIEARISRRPGRVP